MLHVLPFSSSFPSKYDFPFGEVGDIIELIYSCLYVQQIFSKVLLSGISSIYPLDSYPANMEMIICISISINNISNISYIDSCREYYTQFFFKDSKRWCNNQKVCIKISIYLQYGLQTLVGKQERVWEVIFSFKKSCTL